jgi:hypothetical protein
MGAGTYKGQRIKKGERGAFYIDTRFYIDPDKVGKKKTGKKKSKKRK